MSKVPAHNAKRVPGEVAKAPTDVPREPSRPLDENIEIEFVGQPRALRRSKGLPTLHQSGCQCIDHASSRRTVIDPIKEIFIELILAFKEVLLTSVTTLREIAKIAIHAFTIHLALKLAFIVFVITVVLTLD